jgi:hypothetical protein
MWQKGSMLLISLLVSTLIIAGATIYMLQGSWSGSSTKSGYAADIDQAKEAQIQADFHSIQTALESYRLKNNQYPESLDQLVKASMLSGNQKNPYTTKPYDYESDGKTYTLSTKLGDGRDYQIIN